MNTTTSSNDSKSADGPVRARRTLQRRILTLVIGLNVVFTVLACAVAYHFQKAGFINGVDKVLLAGAIGAQHDYGNQYQRSMLDGRELSPQEEFRYASRISDLANNLKLNYVGALVRRDDKLYYTISSSPAHELEDGTWDRVWTQYYDATPALLATFRDGKLRYEDHEDSYGRFRSAYVPYRLPGSDNGADYVYVADLSLEYIFDHLHRTLAKTVIAGLVVFSVSVCVALLLAHRLARPMARLAHLIRSVADRDFQMAPEHRETLDGIAENSYQEVADVSIAFCRMDGMLEDYIDELRKTTAERERIASELSIARDIQNGLLPHKLPQLPGCDVFARVIPAKEVGGDLFEAIALDEDRLLLMVADVSGKGISAGMFMAVTKTLLDAAREKCSRPEEIVTFVNEHLSAENDACMFVTMFLAILDTRTGWMHYTNGGHNPPYIRRQGGKLESLAERHGMALGIAGGQTYAADMVMLEPGDLLVLYSDGVTEAQDKSESLFSESRLENCLRGMATETAGEAGAEIIDRVYQFQGDAPQFDDITLLTLRYTAPVAAKLEPSLA